MTYYRLVLDPRGPYLVDEANIVTNLVTALRAKTVTVEHETNFRFLDGHHGPLHYIRLSRRLIGNHFCAPLSARDAEDIAKAAGVRIIQRTTPIAKVSVPDHPPVDLGEIHLSVCHFSRLPVLEEIDDPGISDGFWARRAASMHSIAVRENGAWVDRDVVFDHR